jgi:undecaprenyl pyrophosphate phosphatase UppP
MTATVAVVVSCLSGLLAIGGLMRQVQRKTLGPYAGYRFFIAAVFAAVIWFRSRGIA